MPDDFDAGALLIACDLVEQGGMPDQAERLRWLVEKEVATRPGGWFAELIRDGRDLALNFWFPVDGESDWPPKVLLALRHPTGRRQFSISVASLRDANGWLDERDLIRPISALPGGEGCRRLVRIEVAEPDHA